ncbi:hypothetical protein Kuura_008 [Caulobacter phage Kuura]|nr:hypothetical protein Kuura_008 [Caulobacter phage Kuura]
MDEFKPFAGLAVNMVPRDPELTREEKQAVGRMCVPGAPIWKILKSAVDNAEHLRDHIAALDLSDPAELALARQLQLRRKAALDFLVFFARATQTSPTDKDLTNASH